MLHKTKKERILILGGSGFIGHALFRELQSYYDVHATYCKPSENFSENHVFHQFDMEKDSLFPILNFIRPTLIIASVKGEQRAQINMFNEISHFISAEKRCRILFISSHQVFDAKFQHPSYENDVPLSLSEIGKNKIAIEKQLLTKIPDHTGILRLPLILGINSPQIFHLRQCIRHHATFEVFPNLVITANTIDKICLQIHYIINQSLTGIFHLASDDMIHHDELFMEITQKLSSDLPIFKNVYTSNEDRYQAILPRQKRLPKSYRISVEEIIRSSTLSEEIISID